VNTEICSVNHLCAEEERELFRLFDLFYANTDESRFQMDLHEKDWVIRLRSEDRVVGFSTQKLFPFSGPDGPVRILFSGDTIVHPDFWDRIHLSGAFGHLVFQLLDQPGPPLYWFLISKGFRTYRFLPVFFHHFFPRYDAKDPHLKPLRDLVAFSRFANEFDPETGLIEFRQQRDHALPSVGHIPENRLSDPHISFFATANPDHVAGVELACICPLVKENITRCGDRVIRRTPVSWNA